MCMYEQGIYRYGSSNVPITFLGREKVTLVLWRVVCVCGVCVATGSCVLRQIVRRLVVVCVPMVRSCESRRRMVSLGVSRAPVGLFVYK